jgi:ketosteroid isomerase-like protein
MKQVLLVLALAALAAGPAAAAVENDVMARVHQFVDGFNKGDVKSAQAACAEQMVILDDIPPHLWQGAGAFTKWIGDYDIDARKNGITGEVVTLGVPRHVNVTADRAYVVVPASCTYKKHGKPVQESGATITLSLQKSAAGWRITGWAWAKP